MLWTRTSVGLLKYLHVDFPCLDIHTPLQLESKKQDPKDKLEKLLVF